MCWILLDAKKKGERMSKTYAFLLGETVIAWASEYGDDYSQGMGLCKIP